MNANESFVPAWAEQALGKKQAEELAVIELELRMLRSFYRAWEALHSIPNKTENRRKSEAAAEALVEAAMPLRTLNAEATIKRIANGN